MKYRLIFLLLLLVFSFFYSCSPAKHLKDNDMMLTKNNVKVNFKDSESPIEELIHSRKPKKKMKKASNTKFSDLTYLIRPVTNKRFLDIPLKASIYSACYPKTDPKTDSVIKDTKFRAWMRKNFGEEPVLLDTNLVSYSVEQLKIAMKNLGYFDADVTAEIDYTKEKKHKVSVTYYVQTKKPYYIRNVKYYVGIPEFRRIIYQDTARSLITKNSQYNADNLLAERDRMISAIRNKGYYHVPNSIIYFSVDTIGSWQRLNKKQYPTVDVDVMLDFSRVRSKDAQQKIDYKYKYNKVFVYTNFDPVTDSKQGPMDTVRVQDRRNKNDSTYYYFITHKNVQKPGKEYKPIKDYKYGTLMGNIFTKKQISYSQDNVSRSYRRINDLKNFNFVDIDFKENTNTLDTVSKTGTLDVIYTLSRSKVHSFSYELDVRSDKGNISVTYSNKNIFRAAEIFNVNVYGGMDLHSKRNANDKMIFYAENVDIGGELSLDFPRLLFVKRVRKIKSLKYSTRISLGVQFQHTTLYQRTIFNTAYNYKWTRNSQLNHSLSPIDISIVTIKKYDGFDSVISQYSKAFQQKFKENVLLSFKYSFNYIIPMKNTKNQLNIRLSLESSGMLVTAINAAAQRPKNEEGQWQFFGLDYATYEMAELDLRYKYTINKNNAIATRFNCGIGIPVINSQVLPFEKSFYLGGSNSMRAWNYRALGPGSYYSSDRQERCGDIKLEMNVEYRGPIYKFIKFGVFVDAGNVWLLKKDEDMPNAEFNFNRFYKEIALATGVGIRLDFNFFLIRVDAGLPIYDPNNLQPDRWIDSFSFKKFFFTFAIGYAF